MNKTKSEIKDIKVDGNTIRFINVCKGEEDEANIIIESRKVVKNK